MPVKSTKTLDDKILDPLHLEVCTNICQKTTVNSQRNCRAKLKFKEGDFTSSPLWVLKNWCGPEIVVYITKENHMMA